MTTFEFLKLLYFYPTCLLFRTNIAPHRLCVNKKVAFCTLESNGNATHSSEQNLKVLHILQTEANFHQYSPHKPYFLTFYE